MPRRSSKKPKAVKAPTTDAAPEQPVAADQPEDAASTSAGKNPAAVALGKLGGQKGGRARAAKLSKEQRREIARKAAQARWAKSSG